MAKLKGWDNISEAQRRRYTNKGITRADYESGVSLEAARGHGNDKAYRAIKKQVGGSFVTDTKLTAKQKREAAESMVTEKMHKIGGQFQVPGFDKMSLADKVRWERNYRLGFMMPGKHDDERHEARIMFLGELDKLKLTIPETEMDWKKFKDDYQSMFSSGIR